MDEDIFLSYEVDLKKQDLKIFWKDDKGQVFRSIQNLKTWVETKNKTLLFATNAGMYKTDNSPLGLFIQNGKTITPLNRRTATGNFYWKPNGVLYIDMENNGAIVKTENFINNGKVKYATQSGPMLVFDGKIHPEFKQGSINLNIRNGVGLLPGNKLVFVMSKKEINLYDLAHYFKKLGCKNALSFDGFVCRTYLPGKNWVQLDGNFGPIVGVTADR
ncbi:MAG: phosphodiester glycosidase family protein [Ferruginibacter sp.]